MKYTYSYNQIKYKFNKPYYQLEIYKDSKRIGSFYIGLLDGYKQKLILKIFETINQELEK